MTDPRIELLSATMEDAAAVATRLDRARILIVGDEGSAVLALAVANLISRFAPGVDLDLPNTWATFPIFGRGMLPELGATVVQRAAVSVPKRPASEPILIDTTAQRTDAWLHVTADAWSLRISRQPGERLEGEGPGVLAAAALVAAEAFRHLLPELPGVRLTQSVEWNLVNYALTLAPNTPTAEPVDFALFGAGSVGSSVIYTLLLSGALGSVEVIDDDALVNRNRLRYPAMLRAGSGLKVEWLREIAAGSSLDVVPRAMNAASWVEMREDPVAVAVSAVDTVAGRREAADALARTTYNAGVDGTRLHVSRHGFGDGFACVYCQYLDVRPPADQAEVLAGMTGLELERVRSLVAGQRLTSGDIEDMIRSGRLEHGDDEFVGARLADMVRGRLYAQAPVRTATGGVAVTAPFVPALAGAILAAELLKASAPLTQLDRRVDVDLSGYPTGLTSRPAADASGRCLCASPARKLAWIEAWSAP